MPHTRPGNYARIIAKPTTEVNAYMDFNHMFKTIKGFFNLNAGRARHRTIRKRISEGTRIDGIHVCQLVAAMLIASIGLNINSVEAIIGSMLICPLMGSVLGMAYGVATLNRAYLKESCAGLVVQIVLCLITSTLYFALSPLSNTTSELLTNFSATVWDVVIAFVGGFVGALAYSRKEEPSTLIAGVAVATSLMPPLCSTGFGMASGNWSLAFAAFYKFVINVVFIGFGAELVLVWLRLPLQYDLDGDGVVTDEERAQVTEQSESMRRRVLICSLLIALPCLYYSAILVRQSIEETGTVFEVTDTYKTQETTYELQAICPGLVSYRIGEEDSFDTREKKLKQRVVATVETSKKLGKTKRMEVEALIRLNVPGLESVTFAVT